MFNPENFRVEPEEDFSEDGGSSPKSLQEKSEEVRYLLRVWLGEGVKPLDILFLTGKNEFPDSVGQQSLLVALSILTVLRFVFLKTLKIGLKLSVSVLQILIEEFED